MRYLLFILAFAASLHTTAQKMQGKVVDAKTGEMLYPVTVVNMLTQQQVYTNEQGAFSITAKAGEQLAFFYVGYKSAERLIQAGATEMRVELQPMKVQLNELVVRPRDYSPYQIDSIERRSTYKRTLARRKASAMSPFSFVAEKFSKTAKQTYRFQKAYNYLEDQRFIDSKYTSDLVSEMTGLDGDSLAHFMNAYPMPYDYARTATDLEIKMWIRTNHKKWKEHPSVPAIPADTLLKTKD